MNKTLPNYLMVDLGVSTYPVNLDSYGIHALDKAVVFAHAVLKNSFSVQIEFLDEFKIDKVTKKTRKNIFVLECSDFVLANIMAQNITRVILREAEKHRQILQK